MSWRRALGRRAPRRSRRPTRAARATLWSLTRECTDRGTPSPSPRTAGSPSRDSARCRARTGATGPTLRETLSPRSARPARGRARKCGARAASGGRAHVLASRVMEQTLPMRSSAPAASLLAWTARAATRGGRPRANTRTQTTGGSLSGRTPARAMGIAPTSGSVGTRATSVARGLRARGARAGRPTSCPKSLAL